MAVLGKRKAPEPTISDQDAQEIFRRHFEARFNPLPAEDCETTNNHDDDDDDGDDDSDFDGDDGSNADNSDAEEEIPEWGGLSSEDDTLDDSGDEAPAIEVVDHSVSQAPKPTTMSKRELKAFMSSRPPDSLADPNSKPTATPRSSSSSTTLPEDAPSLLAQDLELRRLLAESHLFRPSRASSSSASVSSSSLAGAALEPRAFASGRIRQKATDLRIQALGSKASILKQDKMPMHMRKGIHAAATEREAKRRREAKENGIILERETAKNNKPKGSRRGGLDVGRPGVGRMKGAELRISQSDVRRIEGVRDTFGRKGRR